MAKQLTLAQKQSVSRIGGLVLINAMIFQEILADNDGRVKPLGAFLDDANIVRGLQNHWQFIVREIDYYPIFHLASQVLVDLTANPDVVQALRELAGTAQSMVTKRAALKHDLMGRIYHRLLADAKYLGTYYTSIPAAALLLRLSLTPDGPWEWHDIEAVVKLNVADLACGTGTLLMAAADAIEHNYITAAAATGEDPQLERLQNKIAEEVLYGFDVLPSAIHLTASTLALRAPQIPFTKMNLYSLTLGGKDLRLGSIEYLRKGKQLAMFTDLFGATQQVTGGAMEATELPPIPDLDLCVMNPPFTRSVGGNLLFGSMPKPERDKMKSDLKKLVRKTKALANVNAGLGSVFVATADPFIKTGGRLSLVLPKALISGAAWAKTRDLIRKKYTVRFVIASQDPGRWNFSESTSLSEVLLVAVKTVDSDSNASSTLESQGDELIDSKSVTVVNLWRNPSTTFEALAIAQELLTGNAPDMVRGQGALAVSVGNEKVGEAISVDWDFLKNRESWMLPVAFAQNELTRAAYHLEEGKLWLPGYGHVSQLPIVPLGRFAHFGPDRRDIHDAFTETTTPTAYPAVWGHKAGKVTTMSQMPNMFLQPLSEAEEGRKLRRVEDLWPKASKVLIAERFRLNTSRVASARVTEPVLSNVWWPVVFHDSFPKKAEYEKALVMWLNSTLSFLLLLAFRDETEGPWIDFKKPSLDALPVLDVSVLAEVQAHRLAAAYDVLSTENLRPLRQLKADAIRHRIDNSIADALGLPDFSVLRKLLAQEPVICLNRL